MSTLTEDQKLRTLSNYAKAQFATNENRCGALANIIAKAASLYSDKTSGQADAMMTALFRVLIGTSLITGYGRSSGPWFVGSVGSSGFQPDLADQWNQVQHAFAGIYMGKYFLTAAQQFIRNRVEREEQDKRLYDKTFPLGRTLNDSNYTQLSGKVRAAIGDASCLQ